MAIRKAHAVWEGPLKDGQGAVSLAGHKLQVPYSFPSRFEEAAGSNPEELLGGAHAGCFSMALAKELAGAGYPPVRIETSAGVHLDKTANGFAITKVDLETEADVPGIDEATFQQCARNAKNGCLVSRALSALEITLKARLLSVQRV